jgi:type I restriction-modification system DNA methylase subunit
MAAGSCACKTVLRHARPYVFVVLRSRAYTVRETHSATMRLKSFSFMKRAKMANTFHAWKRGEAVEEPGYAKTATLDDVRAHEHVLTPGRYVGAAAQEDDGEPFDQKMTRLTATLSDQFAESDRLESAIRQNLAGLGYPLKTPA